MNRQNRISEESICTCETEDPDFDIENMSIISPESIHELIRRSVALSHLDKTSIQQLFWLVFTKQLQEDIAKHCILQILRSDTNVYDTFVDYVGQCEIFEKILST